MNDGQKGPKGMILGKGYQRWARSVAQSAHRDRRQNMLLALRLAMLTRAEKKILALRGLSHVSYREISHTRKLSIQAVKLIERAARTRVKHYYKLLQQED